MANDTASPTIPLIDATIQHLREKYPDKFSNFDPRPQKAPDQTGANSSNGTRRSTIPDGSTKYGLRALEIETLRLANAATGKRNATLNEVAFRLFQLVGGNELDRSETDAAIRSAAAQCGLEEHEINHTMRNATTAGLAAPRSAPNDTRTYDEDCPDIPAEFLNQNHPQHKELKKTQYKPKFQKRTIKVTLEEFSVNNQAIAALSLHETTFVRGGILTHVTYQEATNLPNTAIHIPAGAKIGALQKPTLRERLTEVANWFEPKKNADPDKEDQDIPTRPPEWCVSGVLARGAWPGVRQLNAVVEFPAFLPDGSILTKNGYDSSSGLYSAPISPCEISVPDEPTISDAAASLAVIKDAVCDFPFIEDHHRSAWLAGLMTPLARFAFAGPSPMFLVEANVPGAGKGLLIDTATIIIRGNEAATLPFTNDNEELQKLLTALLIQGETIALFDNVEGSLGGAVLNKLLTSTIWEGRILGQSETKKVPNLCTWWATGNNVSTLGDTARRVCSVKMESPLENPESRMDIKREHQREWVRANRSKLLSAVLTVLKAYHVAGRPRQEMRQWGSYYEWSELIRGAIIWAGWPDPFADGTSARQEDDPIRGAMIVLLDEWETIDPQCHGLTSARVIESINQLTNSGESLREALEILAPANSRSRPRSLGTVFREYSSRKINGRSLEKSMSRGLIYWKVKGERLNKPKPNIDDLAPTVEIDFSQIPS